MKNVRFLLILMFLTGFRMVFSHDLQVVIDLKPPFVAIHSQYNENERCSYADVSIFNPVNDKTEFQVGYADVNGNFSFLPDTPGTWTVKVDDGMGHVKNVKIEITDSFLSRAHGEVENGGGAVNEALSGEAVPLYLKAVFGLSLILGITGIFYWIKAHRVVKNREKSIET